MVIICFLYINKVISFYKNIDQIVIINTFFCNKIFYKGRLVDFHYVYL